jgi:Tol biopolymer transport system component/DNA-binding winged helix-turn-helix (wHTH) protein
MAPSPITPDRIHFDQFEADLRSGELRKNGRKIRLQPQPFHLLALLLERPGEVVSREEVCQKLWPDGTHVEFDRGLGTALNKLREALNDSAEKPRFVETLPRRGFRFIGTIQSPAVEIVKPKSETPTLPSPIEVGFSRKATAALLGLCLIALVIGFAWWNHRSHAAVLLPKPIVFTAYPGDEIVPSFSPDGSQIAFGWNGDKGHAQNGFDLFVKAIGNENPIRLTNTPSTWVSSAWSPDGTAIAIHRVSRGGSGIYLVPAQGGPEKKLHDTYATNGWNSIVSWAPDGKSIAFSDAPSPDGKRRVQILSLADSKITQIPHDENCSEEHTPAFSHDGMRIAYICAIEWEEYALAIQDLREMKPKLFKSSRGWPDGIAWTAGDHSLIFGHHQVDHETDGLKEMVVSDGSVRSLPYGPYALAPAIAAKSARLAFSNGSDGHTSVWRFDLANADAPPVELISTTRHDCQAQYSGDGAKIVFVSTRTGSPEIWMSNPEGKELVQLTNLGQRSGSPRWSPDGRKITFDSRENGHAVVYVVDVGERIPRKVGVDVAEPSMPSWSRDGKWIYFIGGSGPNGGRIYRAHAEGGEATPLSTASGFGPIESFDAKSVFFGTAGDGHTRLETASLSPTGTENAVKGMPRMSPVSWAMVSGGVYFFPDDITDTLSYFDFARQTVRPIRKIGPGTFYGVSISPDARYSLGCKTELSGREIMLVNNFQ